VALTEAMNVAQKIVALDSSYNSHRPLPHHHSKNHIDFMIALSEFISGIDCKLELGLKVCSSLYL